MGELREGRDFRVVFVTAGAEEEGAKIARALVGEKLAACVNIVPGLRSIYAWKGKIEDDPEVLLIIKTVASNLEALSRRVAELHSYDVPEVVALALDRGRESYLDWLAENCHTSVGE
ncbi:MAG: divalent-cation tolerance protein CutA [bacterium]|nr:divalent-cation tolerance protein CutA [bacterium]